MAIRPTSPPPPPHAKKRVPPPPVSASPVSVAYACWLAPVPGCCPVQPAALRFGSCEVDAIPIATADNPLMPYTIANAIV